MNFPPPEGTLTHRSVCLVGGDKEDEAGGERRGKKRKNVKGKSGGAILAARMRASWIILNHRRSLMHKSLSCVSQVPDPSQVTAMATQSSVAAWLIIYFRPSDSIKSLLRSPINTASATRDSTGWDVCWQPRPPCWWARQRSMRTLKMEASVDQWDRRWRAPDTMDTPGSQCNLEPNKLLSSLVCQLLLYLGLFSVFKGDFT